MSNKNPTNNHWSGHRWSRRVCNFCSSSDKRGVSVKRHKHHAKWKLCLTQVNVN